MKKRATLLLSVFLLPVPLILFSWFYFFPEYGDSYSEQLRKLWNSRGTKYHMFSEDKSEELSRKNRGYEQARKQSIQLQESRGLKVSVDIGRLPDLEGMVFSGLSRVELIQRALSGDGDACLFLATYEEKSLFWKFHLIKKWLEKANELGRPGSKFLLEIANKAFKEDDPRKESRALMWLSDGGQFEYIKNTPGYEDFRELVLQGDYLAYRVLLAIDKSVASSNLAFEFDEQMENRAMAGSSDAQRIYGEHGLLHLTQSMYYRGRIHDELYREQGILNKASIWLGDFFGMELPLVPISFDTLDLREKYAGWLYKSAKQGDRDAMFLWLTHGITYMETMSREEWEDVFQFAAILFKEGHFGFIDAMWEIKKYPESAPAMFYSYYSSESVKGLESLCRRVVIERGGSEKCWENLMRKELGNLKLCEKALEQMSVSESSILYMDDTFPEYGNSISLMIQIYQTDRKLFDLAFGIVKRAADNGDWRAMLAMGHIFYHQELPEFHDPVRALAYYEKVLEPALAGKEFPAYVDVFKECLPALEDCLMSIYLDESSEFFSPDKAFRTAQTIIGIIDVFRSYGNTEALIYMAWMYQEGYGTAVDLEKAEYYYDLAKRTSSPMDVRKMMEERGLVKSK